MGAWGEIPMLYIFSGKKTMSNYQVLKTFVHPVTGATLQAGDTFDDDGSLGQTLCRSAYVKDITAHVNTIDERVTTLETTVAALSIEQHSASSSASASTSSSASASTSSSASSSASSSTSSSASSSSSASVSSSASASASAS
jgi:hypothetical protein